MAIIRAYYLQNVNSDNKSDTHVYHKTIPSIKMRYTCVSLFMFFTINIIFFSHHLSDLSFNFNEHKNGLKQRTSLFMQLNWKKFLYYDI